MPAAPAFRAVIRQSRFLLRRNNLRQASTTAETASKAQSQAAQATSKASEGLSRVTSSAGSVVSGAASSAQNALSKVGGRTGRYIKFVQESVIPPTIYYSRVAIELSKLVFQGQKMAPPSLQQFQSYFSPLIHAARNPTQLSRFVSRTGSQAASAMPSVASPESMLSSVRNVNRQQLITISVVGAELLGFFTIGTMIGRLKIVGYHGEVHHEH